MLKSENSQRNARKYTKRKKRLCCRGRDYAIKPLLWSEMPLRESIIVVCSVPLSEMMHWTLFAVYTASHTSLAPAEKGQREREWSRAGNQTARRVGRSKISGRCTHLYKQRGGVSWTISRGEFTLARPIHVVLGRQYQLLDESVYIISHWLASEF